MNITSTKVAARGGHDHVSIWIDGKLAGTLVVDAGDGERLREMLALVAAVTEGLFQLVPVTTTTAAGNT